MKKIIKFKGIKFYNCSFNLVLKKINDGGYLVAPAASALSKLEKNKVYYDSLKNADIAILDSGLFCILLRIFKGYKVKKLHILPGQKISLQKHFKRSEHWVVIQGTAYIIKGKKQFKLSANQSTFIKRGEIHRIENKSKKDLIMIEVQTGEYLEEDDIKRFKDIYKR